MTLELTSPAFSHQGQIPSRHTCEGGDTSPALAIAGVPTTAQSLVLIVDDPDAPDPAAPRMTWVHWVLYDLPTMTTTIGEGRTASDLGARAAISDFKRREWGGPCPPIGRHRYFFKLYALDVVLGDLGDAKKPDVEARMKGHVLAETVLMGTYQKGDRP